MIVETGLAVTQGLLMVGTALPLIGNFCKAATKCLKSANQLYKKADDVVEAARRVNDVVDMVSLMTENAAQLDEGRAKAMVEGKMRELIDLLVDYDKAIRAFGEKGWMKRAWKMRKHVSTLAMLDVDVVRVTNSLRDCYNLANDRKMMARSYALEASIEALVAKRVAETGEPEGKVVAVLSEDPAAITAVAKDANVPADELRDELKEFRWSRRGRQLLGRDPFRR